VDEQFKPLPPDVLAKTRRKFDLPEKYILFVGTLEPRKNIPGLLKGYAELRARMPDAPPLLIVGKRGWLFDAAQVSGESVLWHENVPHDELPAVYNMACALVLPAFYEGFGLPALEAMACGTVPIVSNCSSLPEVVGDVGLMIDPHEPTTIADALSKVLTDDAWRAQMQIAARTRAAQFTWERAARVAMTVYRAVL
jgi:glycosyltransferase involved in cell wall biosynthesis